MRYEKLLRATENGPENPKSSTSSPPNEVSNQMETLSLDPEHRSPYTVIDGLRSKFDSLGRDATCDVEKISKLIDQIEATQEEIFEVSSQYGLGI
jgi:hypothetical protein